MDDIFDVFDKDENLPSSEGGAFMPDDDIADTDEFLEGETGISVGEDAIHFAESEESPFLFDGAMDENFGHGIDNTENVVGRREVDDLVEQMRRDFDLSDLEVIENPDFHNAGLSQGISLQFSSDDSIVFDPEFMVDMVQQHGADVVPGIIGHEVGHSLVKPGVDSHQHELTADFVAGMFSARHACSPEAMESFYLSPEVRGQSETHPHGYFRMKNFREGYDLVHENPEVPLKDLFSGTSVDENINKTDLLFNRFFDINEPVTSASEYESRTKVPHGDFHLASVCSRCGGTGSEWWGSSGTMEICPQCGGTGIG